jgi:hypothetical protein
MHFTSVPVPKSQLPDQQLTPATVHNTLLPAHERCIDECMPVANRSYRMAAGLISAESDSGLSCSSHQHISASVIV